MKVLCTVVLNLSKLLYFNIKTHYVKAKKFQGLKNIQQLKGIVMF